MGNMEQRIDDYLASRHSVLWGRAFDLLEGHGAVDAREFILDLLIDLGFSHEDVAGECHEEAP